jgi:UDP-N-acetylglucosamine diphosphorylase/glucosamine-1-phosphate N-acetyltransferase
MRICVFEDAGVVNLYPLTQTRPTFDLLSGTSTLLERQQRFFDAREAGVLVRPSLAELCRANHPELAVNDPMRLRGGPVLLVNARWLPLASVAPTFSESAVGLHGEQVAYVYLRSAELADDFIARLDDHLADWKRTLPRRQAGGIFLDFPWDLVEANPEALKRDHATWKATRGQLGVPQGVTVIGSPEALLVDPAARVEPLVVADTTKGPVLIDHGAVVHAFSRLEGPCYVGSASRILGARLRGGSIGPECRIGGEVEASIFQGYANKAHDGFVGHSYIGEWVNLAAGTQTSDLRIDYAPINLVVNGRKIDTGLLKIGSFVGDHTKTALNALLNAGTVVGPFAQMLTSAAMTPRFVPAFCRYGMSRLQERTDLWEMFTTAATVMKRRDRQWTEPMAEFFHALYEDTSQERHQVIRESEQRRLRRAV